MGERGLSLVDLSVSRSGAAPLFSVNAQIAPGEVLTVMGPSGAGKSTLVAAITGALDPVFTLKGRIALNGRDLTQVSAPHRRVGVLYQDHLLFPHLSVAENLAFGLARGLTNRRERIENALEEIDLKGFSDRDPATLSGGQRARVALMRMMLAQPEAIVLDEPFSRLDADLRVRMRRLVFDRASRAQVPVLLVTHDLEDAKAAGGSLLRLEGVV